MTSVLLASLPLQLVCNLILPEATPVHDTNFALNQPLQQLQLTKLLNGSTAISLGSLSLRTVCQLIATHDTFVTSSHILVRGKTTTEPQPLTLPEDDGQFTTTTTVNFSEDYVDSTPTEVSLMNLPEGYVPFPQDNAAYKIYEKILKWDVARDRCTVEGGHLAIADSEDKIHHILSLSDESNRFDWISVGFYREEVENEEWRRADNDLPATNLPWRQGSRHVTYTRGCAGISLDEPALVVFDCGHDRSFYVCEIPLTNGTQAEETTTEAHFYQEELFNN